MAPREQWWVVGAAAPHQPLRWKIVNSVTKPAGDFIDGPFATRAEAQADYARKTSPITPPSIPNPLQGLSPLAKVSHWIGDAVLHLTDTAMYRSLGWMLLGALLVFGGVYLFFRTSQSYKDLQSAVLGTVKAL